MPYRFNRPDYFDEGRVPAAAANVEPELRSAYQAAMTRIENAHGDLYEEYRNLLDTEAAEAYSVIQAKMNGITDPLERQDAINKSKESFRNMEPHEQATALEEVSNYRIAPGHGGKWFTREGSFEDKYADSGDTLKKLHKMATKLEEYDQSLNTEKNLYYLNPNSYTSPGAQEQGYEITTGANLKSDYRNSFTGSSEDREYNARLKENNALRKDFADAYKPLTAKQAEQLFATESAKQSQLETELAEKVDLSPEAAIKEQPEAARKTAAKDEVAATNAPQAKTNGYNVEYHQMLDEKYAEMAGVPLTIDKGDGTPPIQLDTLQAIHLLGEGGYKQLLNNDPKQIALAEKYSKMDIPPIKDEQGNVLATYAINYVEPTQTIEQDIAPKREAIAVAPLETLKVEELKSTGPTPQEQMQATNDRRAQDTVIMDEAMTYMVNNNYSDNKIKRAEETAATLGGAKEFRDALYAGDDIKWAKKEGKSDLEKLAARKEQTAHNTRGDVNAPAEFAATQTTLAASKAAEEEAMAAQTPSAKPMTDAEFQKHYEALHQNFAKNNVHDLSQINTEKYGEAEIHSGSSYETTTDTYTNKMYTESEEQIHQTFAEIQKDESLDFTDNIMTEKEQAVLTKLQNNINDLTQEGQSAKLAHAGFGREDKYQDTIRVGTATKNDLQVIADTLKAFDIEAELVAGGSDFVPSTLNIVEGKAQAVMRG